VNEIVEMSLEFSRRCAVPVKLRFLRRVRDAQLTVRSSQRVRPNQVETDLITTYTTQLIRQQCVQLNFF
jgi:hypothetical protein